MTHKHPNTANLTNGDPRFETSHARAPEMWRVVTEDTRRTRTPAPRKHFGEQTNTTCRFLVSLFFVSCGWEGAQNRGFVINEPALYTKAIPLDIQKPGRGCVVANPTHPTPPTPRQKKDPGTRQNTARTGRFFVINGGIFRRFLRVLSFYTRGTN